MFWLAKADRVASQKFNYFQILEICENNSKYCLMISWRFHWFHLDNYLTIRVLAPVVECIMSERKGEVLFANFLMMLFGLFKRKICVLNQMIVICFFFTCKFCQKLVSPWGPRIFSLYSIGPLPFTMACRKRRLKSETNGCFPRNS